VSLAITGRAKSKVVPTPRLRNPPGWLAIAVFMPRFATLLLDLDGTIVDAFTTIHRSYVHILPGFGLPAPTVEQVRNAVGGGLENAMRHFLPEAQIAEAVKRHIAHTDAILLEDVTLMPGALELVSTQHAAGVKLAVFTNKRGDHARRICAHLGISPFLDGIFGAKDTAWVKPQPEFAAHVLAHLGARRESTMLVGDSPFDVKAAHNGGFACWCVTTGTHSADQLRAANAEAVFPDLFALHAALQ
jgi:phosphoglycolate phosphatase-like HAD superfamily hydrolase